MFLKEKLNKLINKKNIDPETKQELDLKLASGEINIEQHKHEYAAAIKQNSLRRLKKVLFFSVALTGLCIFIVITKIIGYDLVISQNGKTIVTKKDMVQYCKYFNPSFNMQIYEKKGNTFLTTDTVEYYYKYVPWKFPMSNELKREFDDDRPIEITFWWVLGYEGKVSSWFKGGDYLDTHIIVKSQSRDSIKNKEERLRKWLSGICPRD